MANPFAQLEKQFERFIERPLQRLFGGRLEPADIAKHLSRAMEDERQIFSGRLIGPNLYEVRLSTEDQAHFKSYEATLRQDLSDYLVDLAERRGITLLGRPEIRMLPTEELKRGDIQVSAQLVDRAGETQHTRQFTVPLQAVDAPEEPAEMAAPAWLEMRDRTVALSEPFVTLGRSMDNDIIVEEDDVSRQHAQIKLKGGNYVVTDLQSANGTKVNGQRITECVLRDGDELCLATSCMTFHLATPRRGR